MAKMITLKLTEEQYEALQTCIEGDIDRYGDEEDDTDMMAYIEVLQSIELP
jgi:hypothetical protein